MTNGIADCCMNKQQFRIGNYFLDLRHLVGFLLRIQLPASKAINERLASYPGMIYISSINTVENERNPRES